MRKQKGCSCGLVGQDTRQWRPDANEQHLGVTLTFLLCLLEDDLSRRGSPSLALAGPLLLSLKQADSTQGSLLSLGQLVIAHLLVVFRVRVEPGGGSRGGRGGGRGAREQVGDRRELGLEPLDFLEEGKKARRGQRAKG